MKKKVFLVLSSLRAGGAERVFWLLAQHFDKTRFDVHLVILDSQNPFFSLDIEGLQVIDLKTINASKSFPRLLKLIREQKPDVVFSTGGQMDILMGLISLFHKIPCLIARPTNVDKARFMNLKSKFWEKVGNVLYKRFNKIICQSDEIHMSVKAKGVISESKIIVIPNPVLESQFLRASERIGYTKKLIVVSRLTEQKGIFRLIEMMKDMPENFSLIIAGDGPLRDHLNESILEMNLAHRVKLVGVLNNVREVAAEQDLFVLPSFIEGFPNVVIESLSVGTPVVAFEVGGISQILKDDFNGYIVKQDDTDEFKRKVVQACNTKWNSAAIKADINDRFGIQKIVNQYQALISNLN